MEIKTIIEPFRIKMVEPIKLTTQSQRVKYLKKARYNPFLLTSEQVIIDLLTDSGTAAMSSDQWAGMMRGDESYAGASSWQRLEKAIVDLTGYPYVLPTHQGRAAERILYSYLGGKGKVFISNAHFDTTRANIEYSGSLAFDCTVKDGDEPASQQPFKGNLDIEAAEKLILKYKAKNIGALILTVTNNSKGGQPVSMKNAIAAKKLCKKHGILFILDACRVAENSYFIKHGEKKYASLTYREIAKQMFRLADGCIMSAKKDAIVNMGGFLALNNKEIADACTSSLIITEGFTTYGGLSGRDMEAIAVGLDEVFDPGYLNYRIKSTTYLGEKLAEKGVPVILPVGGHAVYIDAKKFYPDIPVDQYPGQVLVGELYTKGGIRCCELGSVMFGKYNKKGKLIPAEQELVRLAIPRRMYTQSHIDYVIEVFDSVIASKKRAVGLKITEEPEFLRHFTCKFDKVKD